MFVLFGWSSFYVAIKITFRLINDNKIHLNFVCRAMPWMAMKSLLQFRKYVDTYSMNMRFTAAVAASFIQI